MSTVTTAIRPSTAALLMVLAAQTLAADPTMGGQRHVFQVADGDIPGLVDAIQAANDEARYPGPDVIELAAGGIYTLSQGHDPNGVSGLPTISSEITIAGQGATIARADEAGTPEFTLMSVSHTGAAALNDLTLRNGRSAEGPGGLSNDGVAVLEGCELLDNSGVSGGAVRSTGRLRMADCRLVGNSAQVYGGAVYAADGVVRLIDCELRANSAHSHGSAVFSFGPVHLRGCTIVHNVSERDTAESSAITSTAEVTMVDSDIHDNSNCGVIALGGSIEIERCSFQTNGHSAVNALSGLLHVTDSDFSDNQIGIACNAELAAIARCRFGGNDWGVSAQGGSATLSACSFLGNGIGLALWGPAQVEASTFAGNSIRGIYLAAGALELRNSTVSGNGVCGIRVTDQAAATIDSSTICRNHGPEGNLFAEAPVIVRNTIIADSDGQDVRTLDSDHFVDDGYNLVQDPNTVSHPASQMGDPRLGPLADNGGPTLTHALLPGSLAIDAGACADDLATDQRGVARPQGRRCDIGAYELVYRAFEPRRGPQ